MDADVEFYRGGLGPLLEMVARNPASPGTLHEHLVDIDIERVRVKVGSPAHQAIKAGDFSPWIDQAPRRAFYETRGQVIELDEVVDFEVKA